MNSLIKSEMSQYLLTLFSMDVDSLYTNIDMTLGLKAVEAIFQKYPDDRRPDEALLTLLERNDFEFGASCFLQIQRQWVKNLQQHMQIFTWPIGKRRF